MNIVNNVIVEPETTNFQFNKPDNDQDSDMDDDISEVFDSSKYINGTSSTDCASCSGCGLVLKNEEEIDIHSQVCQVINNEILHNLSASTTINIESSRFSCDICDKKFKRKHNLKQHMKLHAGKRPYNCKTRTKLFNRKNHLGRHKEF